MVCEKSESRKGVLLLERKFLGYWKWVTSVKGVKGLGGLDFSSLEQFRETYEVSEICLQVGLRSG